MKMFFVLSTLVLALSSKLFAANPTLFGVQLVAAKHEIMYFKFDRELIDATIEIYDQKGKLIALHTLQKSDRRRCKLIIDFIDVAPGNYTVIVAKNDKFRAFHYTQLDLDDYLTTCAPTRNDITFHW